MRDALTKTIGFLGLPLEVEVHTPSELVERHVLRQPSPREREVIRQYLDRVDFMHLLRPYFEREKGDKPGTFGDLLPCDRQYFWVVEGPLRRPEGAHQDLHYDLCDAFYLAGPDIQSPLFLDENARPCGWDAQLHVSQILDGPIAVTAVVLSNVRELAVKSLAVYKQHPDIARARDTLRVLRTMNRAAPFTLLGYFAVLESLLTHNPHGDYDSLGHQIQSKMNLLDKRFAVPLPYSRFGGMKPDVLWKKKLYKCRSVIAHGGELSFTGDLHQLGTLRQTFEFVELAVKAIMRQAILEPDLVMALREC